MLLTDRAVPVLCLTSGGNVRYLYVEVALSVVVRWRSCSKANMFSLLLGKVLSGLLELF